MTEEVPEASKRELNNRRGHHASKITRSGKKITELCECPIGDLDVAVIESYQTTLTQSWTEWETLHYHIQDSVEVDSQAREDALLEKVETQVEQLGNKLKSLHMKATVHPILLDVRGELELLASEEVDKHQATSLRLLRARFASSKEMSTRHMSTDPVLIELAVDISKRLQRLERALSMVTTPAVSGSTSYRGDAVRDHDSRSYHHRKLPTIEIPKFGGDVLEWGEFWKVFERTVHSNKDLEDDERRSYLQQAVSDKSRTNLIDSLGGSYSECVASLKARYDQPRRIHQHHVKTYFTCHPCKDESMKELSRLHATLSHAKKGLIDTKHYTADNLLESFAESLLPPTSWRKWAEQEKDQHSIPKVDDLLAFVEFQANLAQRDTTESPTSRRERAQERPRQERHEPSYKKGRGKPNYQPNVKKEVYSAAKVWPDCKLCGKGSHPMYVCATYLSYDLKKRSDYVRKGKLCVNCMGESHDVSTCRDTYRCRECGNKHNTTLHLPADAPVDQGTSQDVLLAKDDSRELTSTISPTMELTVHSPNGSETTVTALFDTGAKITLVTDEVVNRLGLMRQRSNVRVVGVSGDYEDNPTVATVSLNITSPHREGSRLKTKAFVVSRIGGGQGGRVRDGDWSMLEGLTLANPNFCQPENLELLLGNNVLGKIALTNVKKSGELIAHDTIFGWVVNGEMNSDKPRNVENQYVCAVTGEELTSKLLDAQEVTNQHIQEFFRSESLPEHTTQTAEDAEALEHYRQNHRILPDGKFQVSLPRLRNGPVLGVSRSQAVRRYMQNEKALLCKGKLQPFQTVMKEYLELRHAELVPQIDLQKPTNSMYYLPMHPVYKESTTSPLRVVFDASAESSSGVSLNDTLLTGPTVYPPLTDILIRFRIHDIALTADISKMFRCIVLDPEDRDLHRFVWRREPNGRLEDYHMTRVTFGVASSPFLATQTLQQISDNTSSTHPLASQALKESFYVDDYIAGASTNGQAGRIRRELQEVLEGHGLTIRKWRANSRAVLQQIPEELREDQPDKEPYGPDDHPKILGIRWNSSADEFHVSTSRLQQSQVVTKRTLASDVAQTFDILGWFAPATILMKLTIQDLWRTKHDWDDPTSDLVQKQWTQWKSELPLLAAQPLPRRYFHPGLVPSETQLHGFADASLKGYAAVVYVRALYPAAPPTVRLVMAKTKVTPVKGTTVPRLELCAAQLLAELITHVKGALNLPDTQLNCWSDSQVVLYWLDGKRRKNRTYVANRVNHTLELVPPNRWKHVPGIENPADCASRGISPLELLRHPLWWEGPPWLHQEPYTCPPQPALNHLTEDQVIVQETVAIAERQPPLLILSRSSSYDKTRRTWAWVVRFTTNVRWKTTGIAKTTGRRLLLREIIRAETQLHLQSQRRMIPANHPEKWLTDRTTRGLNPKMDKSGVYRVDGRLHNSPLDYAARHPIILKGTDQLTRQIIIHHHYETLHGGPSQVLTSLSRQYYLINGMAVVKAACRSCVVCIRFYARKEKQLMGQLPGYRVTPGRVFDVVGMDFAGPITINQGNPRKPRRQKAYICVLVCMATKAIHLEAVTSLTTEAFMACLRRFIARRGKPSTIVSDNGTNFQGAAHEIDTIFHLMQTEELQESVSRYCTNERIQWQFSPARAPHFGGIWEATVKSVKHHLRRVEYN